MTGADFLNLDRGQAPVRGLADWLTAELRAAVLDGRLAPGAHLPPTRLLADDLSVARGVVVRAYGRLADEGLVTSGPRRGTVVRPHVPPTHVPPTRSARRHRPGAATASRRRPPGPVELDLSPNVPDLSLFPRAAWMRAQKEALDQASNADLGYGDPAGALVLRAELAGWLARMRGLQVEPDAVMIVSGVAQALALLAIVQVRAGHHDVGVEDPGSRGAIDQVAYWGLRPVPIAVDEGGIDVDRLRRAGPAAALVTPAHQFPAGVVLAPDRRSALLGWARETDALIIEDDYDADQRYDRSPVPALHASAPDHVAYAGSASKAIAPGLRLGWLVVPPRMRAAVVEAKYASDIGSPVLPQLVVARLIANGSYERSLRLARIRQRERRDAMVAAVRRHLPGATVHGVAAGLHLMLTFDTADWSDRDYAAALDAEGVRVDPLGRHRGRPGPPGLVLGYAALSPARIEEAVERMARVLP